MENKLRLYHIKTEYVDYLKSFQQHIWDNEEKGKLRPYVGIVIKINDFKYYAPLSSPKPKHINMKEGLDLIKIFHKSDLKCVINLNNLIPVHDKDIILIDIDNEELNYSNLLKLEIAEIRRRKDEIIRKANSIYSKVTRFSQESSNTYLVRKCYDFKLLENECNKYQLIKRIEEIEQVNEELDA